MRTERRNTGFRFSFLFLLPFYNDCFESFNVKTVLSKNLSVMAERDSAFRHREKRTKSRNNKKIKGDKGFTYKFLSPFLYRKVTGLRNFSLFNRTNLIYYGEFSNFGES